MAVTNNGPKQSSKAAFVGQFQRIEFHKDLAKKVVMPKASSTCSLMV